MTEESFKIRPMTPSDMELAAHWAAREGWNPGLVDSACFASVDAGGFLIGELGGTPAATISVVNYDSSFAFLGFYIVMPERAARLRVAAGTAAESSLHEYITDYFHSRAVGLRACDYRRCPKPRPSFKACCRRAPTVRFIEREILATGVLLFECAFSSR
jgi:hypothetical protein